MYLTEVRVRARARVCPCVSFFVCVCAFVRAFVRACVRACEPTVEAQAAEVQAAAALRAEERYTKPKIL